MSPAATPLLEIRNVEAGYGGQKCCATFRSMFPQLKSSR